MLAVIIGLVIGIGLPIQTSINSRLNQAVGSPFVASLVSFTLGTIFLTIIMLIEGRPLFFSWHFLMQQPPWLWIGGLFGVIYLTANILLFPKLGSIQTVIMPILGQIIMGLLIDNFGIFDSLIRPVTMLRLIGASLVVVGVIGAVSINQIIAKKHDRMLKVQVLPNLWSYRIAGVIAGMFSASQTAINGHLGIVLKSNVQAALISFLVGVIFLVILVVILRPHFHLERRKNPWWMWLGGIIGAIFVLSNIYLVPILGTGLVVVVVLVGIISGSLLIDQFGLFQSKKNPITFAQVVSLLIMVSGVVIIRTL